MTLHQVAAAVPPCCTGPVLSLLLLLRMCAVQERAGESGTVQRRTVGEWRRGGVMALPCSMTRGLESAVATVHESLGPILTHWDGSTPCKKPLSRCG